LWVGKWFKTIDTQEMVELICETHVRQQCGVSKSPPQLSRVEETTHL
jgi:hypothetical protein